MTENKFPLVSIIITTYKRSDMLKRAIDSALNQTYEKIEVIVVDDNNPDTIYRELTEKTMKLYKDNNNVIYIKHKKNMNGAVARNTGIKNAKGEIISFLDDDDWYMPHKTEIQVAYMLKNPRYRATYCGVDRDGIILPTKSEDMSFDLLSGRNLIYTNAIMMYKEDAINCGGWDETFQRHQEAAFMLRYFRSGGLIGAIPECLVKFDTSDRSNVAQNAKINQKHMDHYLSTYKDIIDCCEIRRPGSKKDIYSDRYRSVFLCYLREHNFKGAINIWYKMTKNMPVKFNKDMVKYIVSRIK